MDQWYSIAKSVKVLQKVRWRNWRLLREIEILYFYRPFLKPEAIYVTNTSERYKSPESPNKIKFHGQNFVILINNELYLNLFYQGIDERKRQQMITDLNEITDPIFKKGSNPIIMSSFGLT